MPNKKRALFDGQTGHTFRALRNGQTNTHLVTSTQRHEGVGNREAFSVSETSPPRVQDRIGLFQNQPRRKAKALEREKRNGSFPPFAIVPVGILVSFWNATKRY